MANITFKKYIYSKVFWRNEDDYNFIYKRIQAMGIYNRIDGTPNISAALADLARHGCLLKHDLIKGGGKKDE